MGELKTRPTGESVVGFLAKVEDARREDCKTLVRLMKKVTKAGPKMWGSSGVGEAPEERWR